MVTALDESMSTDKKFDNTHILVGESNEMTQLYANGGERSRFGKDNSETPDYQIRNLFERNSPYYIGNLKHVPSLIAAHSYGNHTTNKLLKETRAKVKEECEKYHLHFQESEWCMLGGDCYPSTPIGINLPNADWIRRDYGSKSVTIENITEAYDKASQGNGFSEEFTWLSNAGITNAYTHDKAEDALRSAAYTYVVAALGSLASLLYYIMIFMGGRDRN